MTTPAEKPLCRCLGIAESEVRAAADYAGCQTVREISQVTSAGAGCMSCHRRIKAILEQAAAATPTAAVES